MTKNEIINEIKSVVMNNGGELSLGWVYLDFRDGELVRFINGCSKKVKYQTIAEIKEYLDTYNKYYAKKTETVETKVENTENTVEVEKNNNNVKNMKFTKKNKDILFNCIWSAFRYFSNMERREVGDYEFGQLVSDMYQTMCGEIETDSEWDEYWDIEESMVTHICEESGAKQINKNHPNEDYYDTIILPSA